jgi:hypothetical protein
VLHGVKAGTVGEHPAGKDALDLSVELDLVHLDEGRSVRRLGRRPGVADPGRHFERPELHSLIDRYFEMRDAPRHLVEGSKDGDRILDLLGACRRCSENARRDHDGQRQSENG